MHVGLLFPSRYLKAVELKGREVTLTIARVVLEDLQQENGEAKSKGVVYFEGTKKGWVLNRTNAMSVAAMFGQETDKWVGRRVTLWPAPFRDPFSGEATVAIRVRGSPDIEKDMSAEIQLPRRKPVRVTLKKTGAKANGKAAPKQPEPEPAHDPVTGEIDEDPPFPSDEDAAMGAQ